MIIDSPYRTYTSPVSTFIKKYRENNGSAVVTVYLPQFIVGHWWESILHNRRSRRLAHQLMLVHGVSITLVPWLLDSSEVIYGRRSRPLPDSSAAVSRWPRSRPTARRRPRPARHPESLSNAPAPPAGAFGVVTARRRAELGRDAGIDHPADAARAQPPEFGPLTKRRWTPPEVFARVDAMPVLALLTLTVMVVALIDAITRREDQVKHLPKFAWIFFIVLLPLIGSILWFALGREYEARSTPMSFGDPRRWQKDAQHTPPPAPRENRTTEQQIADLEREMRLADLEEQVRRRRAEGGAPT